MTDRNSSDCPDAAIGAQAIDKKAADWLAARDSGRWTAQQESSLQAWLAESTRHRVSFLRLENAWRRAGRLRVHRDASADMPTRQALPSPGKTRRWWRKRPWPLSLPQSAAVGLVAAVALGMAIVTMRGNGPFPRDIEQMHATAVGERAVITLSDGSRVTLNTATRVRAQMGKSERRLWLDDGEAYFEVAHDSGRPFIVEAGGQRVRVVGTKFSLRRQGESLQARVVEGRVQVSSASGASALLTADDAADTTPTAVRVRRETKTELDAGLSWLQGKLRLDGMTLDEAASEFNRYNRRKLRILDPKIGAIAIGGTFDATNMDGFARLLSTGFGLTVHHEDDEITVGPAVARAEGTDASHAKSAILR